MPTGNKGEWSELYVLLKAITDGYVYQSDSKLNKDLNNYYQIVKGFKDELDYILEFEKNNKIEINKIKRNTNVNLKTYSLAEFTRITKVLFQGIKKGRGSSFGIHKLKDFFDDIELKKASAGATGKQDVKFRIYDHRLSIESDLGFSIKSLIGKKSTLFNTGPGNNFIYNISGGRPIEILPFNKKTYKGPRGKSKLTYRIEELEKKGFEFDFFKIQSAQLAMNLKMIDGDLPKIIARMLYLRWKYSIKKLSKVVDKLEEIDPLDFYDSYSGKQKLYKYKVIRFLTEAAMGMTSETPWHGEYEKFGGVIFVKNDGEILCFHIYDINTLRDYLYRNTFFEQAATGESSDVPGTISESSTKNYNYGWLYKDNEDLKFKINLQVRFNN